MITVHALDPRHLIFRFQLLGDSLALGHLGHEPIEHFFGSSINLLQMGVQCAAEKHPCVNRTLHRPKKPPSALTPDADVW